MVADLEAAGLLVTDDGARCVFLEGVSGKDGKPLPVIVQKSDGGFNYATTDLAAIRYRFAAPPDGDGARRVIYVTDAGQATHFAGVFQVARRAGWIPDRRPGWSTCPSAWCRGTTARNSRPVPATRCA